MVLLACMKNRYVSLNGTIIPADVALLPIDNIEFAYGFGVYETMKLRKGKLYFPDRHIDRLFASAQMIGLEQTYTKAQISRFISDLIEYENATDANCKILLIGGPKPEDAILSISLLSPLYPDRKLYKHGAATITRHYERWMPNAKTLNMLPSYMLYKEAIANECYDTLLVDNDGCIREGTRTNFFCIHDTTIISPPEETILHGVTRDTMLEAARNAGYSFREEAIALDAVRDYDGAFLTSTSTKILPVKQIDETVLEIPDTVKDLMRIYNQYLESC